MERRPTSLLTTLALAMLALTLIAPWVLGQDPDPITEIRRQAEQGDPEAQYNLGNMYFNGEGVPQDAPEAVRWYRLPAGEQGHASAQFNLGIRYYEGLGVLRDSVLGHMWLNIASANGNETARDSRDCLEIGMTPAEIRRATELARECMASDYQDCEPADTAASPSADPVLAVREPESVASESSSLYFTRGSHLLDDVLRIQGTPSSINQYSDHEVWSYEFSTIDIALRDGRVAEWNNISGNLKVRLDAGPNVTDAQTFTRGSDGEGIFDVGGEVTTPTLLTQVLPEYSEEAREVGYQGTVVLETIVRRDGTVDVVRVSRSQPFGLAACRT